MTKVSNLPQIVEMELIMLTEALLTQYSPFFSAVSKFLFSIFGYTHYLGFGQPLSETLYHMVWFDFNCDKANIISPISEIFS